VADVVGVFGAHEVFFARSRRNSLLDNYDGLQPSDVPLSAVFRTANQERCAAITQLENLTVSPHPWDYLRDDSGNETTFAAKPRGNACRDVTPAIASSVSSVIAGGAISSVRRSVSTNSLQSDTIRSGV
jgi:hypothetical protein